MKVYILSTYEEHGAENVVATLDESKLPDMVRAYVGTNDVEAALEALKKVLPTADASSGDPLVSGWGGLQLHVVELV